MDNILLQLSTQVIIQVHTLCIRLDNEVQYEVNPGQALKRYLLRKNEAWQNKKPGIVLHDSLKIR
jgi:hypothetical protein